ncbi:hypothetical protein ACQ4PT_052356 [Festuca glaucescens]
MVPRYWDTKASGIKEETPSSSKPTSKATASSKSSSANVSPVMTVLLDVAPVTTQDLASRFKSRLRVQRNEAYCFLAGSLSAMLSPWAMLLIGAVQNFLRYGWLWLIVTKQPLSMVPSSSSEECYVAHPNGTCADFIFSKRSQDKLHESPEARIILDEEVDQSINDANGDLENSTPYVRTRN